MSRSKAFSGANVFSSQSAPTKRRGQSDDVQKGALASSVNLFKGDVDLNHQLVNLKGRAQNGSDTLKMSIQYGSNVRHDALTWNVEAPTGILGLGWGLPLSLITLDGDGGPTPSGANYTISDNGISSTLVRQDIVPTLLTAAASLLDAVQSGDTVPADLRAVFTGNGLPLSADAVVVGASTGWTLRDAALEQEFKLAIQGDKVTIRYGGEFYQLQNYSFWHIVFYPTYNRWLVIDETGTRRSFGGGVSSTEKGIATSRGNSIAWSIWWTDAEGHPAWSAPSASSSGQIAVANAWYLENVTDRHGNTRRFGYNDFPRKSDTGLLQYAEQSITEGGLPFTKAVYLTSATDVFGRQVSLSYAPKLWSATSAQEYSDPHASTPPLDSAGYFSPTGYQDNYEILYLSGLTVTGTSGRQIMRYAFCYEPSMESPVACIGGSGGIFAKRLLTGITKFDSDDAPVPGLRMSYCLEADPDSGQPGALISLTGASGGTVSYAYKQQSLSQSNRTVDISTDGADQTNLFYGPDYTVLSLYRSSTASLSLRLISWNGTWKVWQPANDGVVTVGNIDLTTLECQPAQDFVVLSYKDFGGNRYVYVWNKLAARPGQWQAADALGLDLPIILSSADNRKLDFYTGAAHFLIADQNLNDPFETGNAITRYSWRWDLGQWIKDQLLLDQGGAWIAAGVNFFTTYSNNDQTMRLYWRNADLSWCETPGSIVMPGACEVNAWENIALVAGPASVAFTRIVSRTTNLQAVQLSSVAWDSDYGLTANDHGVITDYYDASIGTPLTNTPSIVSDSFFALNSNAFRRTDAGWDTVSLITSSNYHNVSQSFVCGQDVIGVMTTNKSNQTFVTMRSWVPGHGWGAGTSPVQVNALAPNDISPTATRNDFNLGGDWLNIGSLLYYRGTSCDWNTVLDAGPSIFMTDTIKATDADFAWLDSKSLVNSAPNFVTLNTVKTNGAGAVTCLVFRNGASSPLVTVLNGRSLYNGGDQGQSAAGQSTFATVDQSSGPPSVIRLHRYQNYSVDGPVTHYTVSGATLDDAMGDISHVAYICFPDSAICSSTGDDVSFHQTITYPGTSDPGVTPFGSVETLYLNTTNGVYQADYFDLLEGQQIAQITRDASDQIVSSTKTRWQVVNTVGSDPITGAQVPLRGGWARAVEQSETSDCVTKTTVMIYETEAQPCSLNGTAQCTLSSQVNGAGETEVFAQTQTPALLPFPILWAQHAIHDQALTVGYCMPMHNGTPLWDRSTVIKAKARMWSSIPSALGSDVMTGALSASYDLVNGTNPVFPFNSPELAADQGWLLARRFTNFTPWSQPSQEVNALGVPSAILHGANGLGVVAHVKDTTITGMVATFFQAWEQLDRLTTDGSYDPDCCFTGTQALRLGVGQSAKATLTPDRAQRYVAALRYRSAAGCVSLGFGGMEVKLDATGDSWSYRTLPLDAPAETLTLSVTAIEGDVWIDALFAVPLASQPSYQLQDPDSLVETTYMDGGGRCQRMLLSPAGDTIGCQSPDDQLHDLRIKGYGRAVSANDSLDASCPNSTLALQFAAGGSVDEFRDGGNWCERWTVTGSSTVSKGILTLTAGSSLNATDRCFSEPEDSEQTTTASIEIQYGGALDFSVSFDGLTVSWSAMGLAADKGTLMAAPATCPRHWVFVRSRGATLFYADGQLLVSLDSTGHRALSIQTNASLALRRLALGYDVRLGVTFADGAGRSRQAQQLWGLDSIVVDSLRDTTNRQIATTKPCPGAFGSGAALPPMAYRPGTVNRPDFHASWESTGRMTGDVADYYSGRTWRGLTPSNDGGYPYYGIRYEASARAQKIEMSSPGTRHAADLTVPAQDRQTLKLSSSATWQSPPPMPGEGPPYHLDDSISANGLTYSKATSKLGKIISLTVGTATGNTLMQSSADRNYTNLAGPRTSTTVKLPRSHGNETTPAEFGFERIQLQDGKRQTLSYTEPNCGETQVVLNSTGAIRFVLPRNGEDEAFCLYKTYDRCGRQIEEGTLEGMWDIATLAPHADDPHWPNPETDSFAVRAAWTTFDGDGSDPLQIGQKITMSRVTRDPDGLAAPVTVTDCYSYDIRNQIASAHRHVTAGTDAEAMLRYTYNTLDQVVSICLPDDAPIPELVYSYTDQGQTKTIRNGATGELLASYVYGPDAKMILQQIHGNHTWTRTLTYTPDERPLCLEASMGDSSPRLRLDYTYTNDGLVQSRAVDLNNAQVADRFSYDDVRALTTVSGTNEASYGPADLNGNLSGLTEGGVISTFTLTPGTDQIATVITGDTPAVPCTWNAHGDMLSGNGRNYTYDRASGRTTRVTQGDAVLNLAYGGLTDRAMKSGSNGEIFYFPGAGTAPLLRKTSAGWDMLVSGPGSMVAFATADERFALVTDVQNSLLLATSDVSAVVEQTMLYRAFGSVNPDLSSAKRPVPYMFQGQEWDGEIGLYNFNARLYDPAMARFHAMDPALQFTSPYVFEANSPVNQTDPTGQMSQGAQVAIGAASVGLAVGGIVLTMATVGLGSAVAAGMEAASAAAAGGVATTTAVTGDVLIEGTVTGVETGGTMAVEGAVDSAVVAEGTGSVAADTSATVEQGVEARSTIARLQGWALKNHTALYNTARIVSGIPIGTGSGGARYTFTTDNKDFNMTHFAIAAAVGGSASVISGVVFATETWCLKKLFKQDRFRNAVQFFTTPITTAVLSDVSQVVTNLMLDKDWSTGLIRTTLTSGFTGFVVASGGAVTSAIGASAGKKKRDYWLNLIETTAPDLLRTGQESSDNSLAARIPVETTALNQSR